MTIASVATAAYLVAALLFIMSLAGLSKHESAVRGWLFGVVGMTVALASTIALSIDDKIGGRTSTVLIILVTMAIGAVIGLWRARIVQMTGMP